MYLSVPLLKLYANLDSRSNVDQDELIRCMRYGEILSQALRTDPMLDSFSIDQLFSEILCGRIAKVALLCIIYQTGELPKLPMDEEETTNERLLNLLLRYQRICDAHLFTDVGALTILLVSDTADDELISSIEEISLELIHSDQSIKQMILSEWKSSPYELFHACNSIAHYQEYQKFLMKPEAFSYVEQNAQMNIPFEDNLDKFRLHTKEIIMAMQAPSFDAAYWACKTNNLLMKYSVGSMEALHRSIQVFASCLAQSLYAYKIVDKRTESLTIFSGLMKNSSNQFMLLSELETQLTAVYTCYKEYQSDMSAKRVQNVREFTAQHISDYTLSVASIAQHFGINRSLLTSEFKKYTGVFLSEYLIQERVRYAQKLIRSNPDSDLGEIARNAGYITMSTMFRNFQKVDGSTPGTYRSEIESSSNTVI